MDVGDLVARADSVVEVRVSGAGARRGHASEGIERAAILTDTRLRVTRVLKGTRSVDLTVTQPGGAIGAEQLVVPELPQFEPGERCLLFLNAQGGVIGGYQGKMSIEDGRVPAMDLSLTQAREWIRELAAGTTPTERPSRTRPAGTMRLAVAASVSANQTVVASSVSALSATTLLNETFDATPAGWSMSGYGGTGFARTTYRKQAGTGSLYCAQSTNAAPGPIPTYVDTDYTRMSPISLVGYNAATFSCDVYSSMQDTPDNWFNVEFAESASGPWYAPNAFAGGSTSGWVHMTVDLSRVNDYWGAGLHDFLGRNVYVRLVFVHGTGSRDEGVYVDNVQVTADNVVLPTIASITPQGRNAGIGETVTITGTDFGATRGTGSVRFPDGRYMDGTTVDGAVVSWSDTRIVCEVPEYAQGGDVEVTSDSGARGASAYTTGFSTGGQRYMTDSATYRINENCADLTGEGAVIQAAFPTWNASGSRFRLAYGGSSGATKNPPSTDNGVNEVFFSSTGFTDSGILAWNYYWLIGNQIIESDIILNDSYSWANGAASGKYDVQTIALHELGHTVGLDDQYLDFSEAMGAGAANSTRRALSQAEIDGSKYLYGAEETTPPSDPTISSATHISQTAWYSSASPNFTFTATDASGIGGYSYALDQNASAVPDTVAEGSATSKSYGGLASGQWYFHVRAVDTFGNWGATSTYGIRVDAIAPATECAQNGVVSRAPVLVSLGASDAHSGVASILYGIDAVPGTAYTGAFLVSGQGTHSINFRSTDAAGNTESVQTAFVTIDGVPPTTSVSAPSSWVHTATVDFNTDDAAASTFFRVDAGGWTPYAAEFPVADEGTRTVEFYSVDVLGNTETTRSVDVFVDRTAPTVSSDVAASYDGPATIALSAADALSQVAAVEYRLDGGSWVQGQSVSVTQTGTHSIEVLARDKAGNVAVSGPTSFTVASGTTRFDQTDPAIVYQGGWRRLFDDGCWTGTAFAADRTGVAYLAFDGLAVWLVGSKGPASGLAKVTIDAGAPALVDFYAPAQVYRASLYSVERLSPGSHIIKVEWTGAKNPASSGTSISLDAVDVSGALQQAVAPTAVARRAPKRRVWRW